MLTLALTGGHTPFVTVQYSTLFPVPRPVTEEEGLVNELRLAVPEKRDQIPEPAVGVSAASVALAEHTVWLIPALALAGRSLITITEELAEGQTPFDTVHTKIFVPLLNAVTTEEELFNAVILPVPPITDQLPVPIVGVAAFNIADDEQTLWLL